MRSHAKFLVFGAMLALLALIVSSPAVMEDMDMAQPTAYGMLSALSALAAAVMLDAEQRRHAPALPDAISAGIVLVPAVLLGARLLYCVIRIPYYAEFGACRVLFPWEGGFLLYGAVLGAAAAVYGMTRKRKTSFAAGMDEIAAPGLLAIALCRLAEGTAGEGLGDWVENEAFWHLPFASMNPYGEYQWAVYLLEAFAALILMAVCLRTAYGTGERALRAILLYACCQIVFESLRMDSVLKIGFVRVSQVGSAVAVLIVTLLHLQGHGRPRAVQRLAAFAFCVALIVGIEFALDKTMISHALLYAAMALLCAALALNGWERAA